MTKDGKPSKAEMKALMKAADILNEWCDGAEVEGDISELGDTYSSAAMAAGALWDFISWETSWKEARYGA